MDILLHLFAEWFNFIAFYSGQDLTGKIIAALGVERKSWKSHTMTFGLCQKLCQDWRNISTPSNSFGQGAEI